MISFLRGKIINKSNNFLIIDVNGVGYKVFVTPALYAEGGIAQATEFYIHEHVREDILALYGFKTMAELEMFELLLSVSGIGPKSALGVLAAASVDDVKETIGQGDPSLLTKVSGIGKKTAERVVLELRSKIGSLSASGTKAGGAAAGGDEIDALMALGYSMSQAREALKGVDPKIKDSGERIRGALKIIR